MKGIMCMANEGKGPNAADRIQFKGTDAKLEAMVASVLKVP